MRNLRKTADLRFPLRLVLPRLRPWESALIMKALVQARIEIPEGVALTDVRNTLAVAMADVGFDPSLIIVTDDD